MGSEVFHTNENLTKFPSSPPPNVNHETVQRMIVAAFDKIRDRCPNAKVWQGCCADYCGVTPRSVQSWSYGESIPGGTEMLRLILWLGDDSDALRGLIGE